MGANLVFLIQSIGTPINEVLNKQSISAIAHLPHIGMPIPWTSNDKNCLRRKCTKFVC